MERVDRVETRAWILLGLVLGLFLAAIETTVVATAMPRVIADLGGEHLYSLPFAFYLLLATVSGPVWGRASDLFGRRRLYLASSVVFLIGSALSGASHSMAFLIGARMVQGLGAGGLLALTFTLVGELYSLQERSRIQGFLSGVWGVSGLIGPIVGGLIVDHTSWRWVFYLNVPFGLAAMALVGRTYTDWPRAVRHSLPVSSAVLFAVGAGLFVYGMQIHGSALLAAGIAALVGFGAFEGRRSSPLIPLDTVRHPLIGRAFVGNLVAGMAFFGCATFVPLFGQAARGGTATEAGILLAPMSVGWTVGSILSARALPSRGPRSLSVAGAVGMIVGFGSWTVFVGAPLWVLGALLLVTGFGMGMLMLALIVSAQEESPREVLGIVTGLIQFARNFGGAIGAGFMGALLGPALVLGGHALYDVFWRVPLAAGVLAVGALVTAAGLPVGAVSRGSRSQNPAGSPRK
jgi:MFS family permease